MNRFILRKDRFDFFNNFEKPQVNICFSLEVDDFISFCRNHHFPVSHFFLFHVLKSLKEIENFMYRIQDGKVATIQNPIASYTVLNANDVFNYTKVDFVDNLRLFLDKSVEARNLSQQSPGLLNVGESFSVNEAKRFFYFTSLPWLKFTSIEHPVFDFKSADIPSVSWGKFCSEDGGLSIPFSVQAHHGFVDALHIYQLAEKIKENIATTMAAKSFSPSSLSDGC